MAKAIILRLKTNQEREALKEEADATHRSLNGYILHLLATHPDRKKKMK